MERNSSQPLELFYCYARKDRSLRDKLNVHLEGLRRSGLITTWYDGAISPGVAWEQEIKVHLNTAHIILLLISPDFLASDYCYSKEMSQAIERHHQKEAHVIPILLRPVDWTGSPFSILQMLPSNARPVTRWANQDDAFEDITKGIRQVVNELLQIASHVNAQSLQDWTFPETRRFASDKVLESLNRYQRNDLFAVDDGVVLYQPPGFNRLDIQGVSTALLVSQKQISFKPGGKLIALALTAKKRFLPVGL